MHGRHTGPLRRAQQLRLIRVVDGVEHGAAAAHDVLRHGAPVRAGVHAHGRAVHEQIPALACKRRFQRGEGHGGEIAREAAGVGQRVQIAQERGGAIRRAPGDEDRLCPAEQRRAAHGAGRAAVAQQQHARSVQPHAAGAEREEEALAVRGAADEAAVLVLHGVYGAEERGRAVYLVEEGNDLALIGNGNVEAVQLAQGGQGGGQRAGSQLKQPVLRLHAGGGKQPPLQKGGYGMPQRAADEAEALLRHGGRSFLIFQKRY